MEEKEKEKILDAPENGFAKVSLTFFSKLYYFGLAVLFWLVVLICIYYNLFIFLAEVKLPHFLLFSIFFNLVSFLLLRYYYKLHSKRVKNEILVLPLFFFFAYFLLCSLVVVYLAWRDWPGWGMD